MSVARDSSFTIGMTSGLHLPFLPSQPNHPPTHHATTHPTPHPPSSPCPPATPLTRHTMAFHPGAHHTAARGTDHDDDEPDGSRGGITRLVPAFPIGTVRPSSFISEKGKKLRELRGVQRDDQLDV